MKQITPVIKRTRVLTERYEVCPHCKQEILEKSTYIDPENYVYHSACMDKGPIQHIEPLSDEELNKVLKGTPLEWPKTAQDKSIAHRFGTLEKNLSGVDYSIKWTADIDGANITAEVTQPANMPDYLWAQVKDALKGDAVESARKMMLATDMARSAVGEDDGPSDNWLERAANSMSIPLAVTASYGGYPDMMPSDIEEFLVDFMGYTKPPSAKGDHWKYTKEGKPNATVAYLNNTKVNIRNSGFDNMLKQLGWSHNMFMEWWKNKKQWLKLARAIGADDAANQFTQKYLQKSNKIIPMEPKKQEPAEPVMEATKIDTMINKFPLLKRQFENMRQFIGRDEFYSIVFDSIKNNPQLLVAYKSLDDQGRAASGQASIVKMANGQWGLKGVSSEIDRVLSAARVKKQPTQKPVNNSIDESLLTDGLGAFLDVFVNYHGGPEGGKLAKWVVAICKDPKFAPVAGKLEQFHKLMSEIYMGVLEIAKQDNETGKKVASALKNIRIDS